VGPESEQEKGRKPLPSRRRRLLLRALPAFILVAGVAAAGTAVATGALAEPEAEAVETSGVSDGVDKLRKAHKASLERALTAPRVLGVKRETLEAIAECESHGDPRAISSDGTYRGKYQFAKSTWRSQGGSGDPAKAPELEQDMRAAILYKAAGPGPWPICGQ
jgi:hypothetical protein